MGSEIINENRVSVTLEIINKIGSSADAWIRQCKQLLATQKSSMKIELLPTHKSSTKCFHG